MFVSINTIIFGISILILVFCLCDYIAGLIFDRFIRPKFFRGDDK